MKKRILLICTAAMSLFACNSIQKHSLVVDIPDWGNDSIVVAFNGVRFDTVVAQAGIVEMDVDTVEEFNYISLIRLGDLFQNRLRLASKSIDLLLLKGEKAYIKGEFKDDVLYYSNSLFPNFEEFHAKTLPYDIVADSINMIIEVGMITGDTTIRPLFNKRGDEYEKIREVSIDYVKSNPDSDLSGYLTASINTTRFMDCYNLLSDEVKGGKYKQLLEQGHQRASEYEVYKAAKESGAITKGKPAPEFTLSSIDGKELSLSDFRGKWVILDFWGSWCGWCIKGVPSMKEFYEKHSDRVEIIGLACNDNDKDWRASVEKHQITWVNLFDDKGTSNKYAVNGFPTKILIDPEGVIQNVKVGDSDDYYEVVSEIAKL